MTFYSSSLNRELEWQSPANLQSVLLNGRIDLTQAEAVMDLIRAKTDKAMSIAIKQLDGSLSQLISDTRQEILNTLAQVEVNIDYPEYDDVEEMTTALCVTKRENFRHF